METKGQLVLVNQADSQLVFLQNPGTLQQTVTSVPVGNQLDDTVWATSSSGRLLVTDGTIGNTYWINAYPGTVYTQAPVDSGVVGFVGVINYEYRICHTVSDRLRESHWHALHTQ